MDCLVTLDHLALQVQVSRFISAIVIYELTSLPPGFDTVFTLLLFLLSSRSVRPAPPAFSWMCWSAADVGGEMQGTARALVRTLLILALFCQLLACQAHQEHQARRDRRGRLDPPGDAIRQIAITTWHRLAHAPAGNKNPLPQTLGFTVTLHTFQ